MFTPAVPLKAVRTDESEPRVIAIFGGPGGGAIVAQSVFALAATGANIRLIGFLNDALPCGTSISGAAVLGPFGSWRDLPEDVTFVAPLHKAGEMQRRAQSVVALNIPSDRWATLIDPKSAVAPDATIGPGSYIGPFATVGPNANIGAQTVIRGGAVVSHDCILGEFVSVGWNAVMCGYTEALIGAYIAPAATIRERCHIGKYAVVGLGSVIVRDVDDFTVVAGNPARCIRQDDA